MDKLNGLIENIEKKTKKYSLKQALILHIIMTMIIIFTISIMIINSCETWTNIIVGKYVPTNQRISNFSDNVAVLQDGDKTYVYIDNISTNDKIIIGILEITKKYSSIIVAIICIIVMTKIYYKNRLLKPIQILKKEADYIKDGNLTYECVHEYSDEMGQICHEFDDMRKILAENEKGIWETISEERRLKSAFMHDIRTPLTVLKGYNDLLLKFYPSGKVDDAKLMETLNMMNVQIARMERYSDAIKCVNSFEELEVNRKDLNINDFITHIDKVVKGIDETNEKKVFFTYSKDNMPDMVEADEQIIITVLENLLSNSLRYCDETIEVQMDYINNHLVFYVKDDGKGFSDEDLKNGCNLYYSKSDDNSHYGLGLYMCKLLTKKHGGKIRLINSIDKGAISEVSFKA